MPPEADILIHAGDFTSFGKPHQVESFNEWLGTLPYEHKIVVAGNHENGVKNLGQKDFTNAVFLSQSSATICGLKVFGTGFFWRSPIFNPAFEEIPNDTQVLISHGPPHHYFDGELGCPSLLKRIKVIKPKLHVFGHIHSAGGQKGYGNEADGLGDTIFVNAANCGENYALVRDPIVVDIDLPNKIEK